MGERTKFVVGFFAVMFVVGIIVDKSGCDKENNLPSGNSSVNNETHTCLYCNKKFTGSGYFFMPPKFGGAGCIVEDKIPNYCSRQCCESAHLGSQFH